MQIRRGLFRVWVVLFLAWAVTIISFSYPDIISELEKQNTVTERNAVISDRGPPPCKNGSAECKPWERDWGNGSPVSCNDNGNDCKPWVIKAPDGNILTFPKEMTKNQVQYVMRELYPWQVQPNTVDQKSHDLPVKCSLARGTIKHDYYVLESGIPPVPDGLELQEPTDLLGNLNSNNVCWYHPDKFRKLYTEYNDLDENKLRNLMYAKLNIEHPQFFPWKLIWEKLCIVLIPPLALLGCWFVGIWVCLGFQKDKLSGRSK